MSIQAAMRVKSHSLTRIKAVGAAVALVAISTIPEAAATASGSPACGSRPELLKQLSGKFKEAPVAAGLAKNGSVIEVLTSDDGETWTILVSRPGVQKTSVRQHPINQF